MNDWTFAQTDPEQQLARLHYFSIMKGGVEFIIKVKEFAEPKDRSMAFFAQCDKQTNQSVTPYTPSGWGDTLFTALAECVREVERFPA
jgi:hypothetical protein